MKTKLLMIVAAGLFLAADEGPADKAKKEMEALQGTWKGVSAEGNGQTAAKDDAESMELIIKGDKYTFKMRGAAPEEGTLKIDPAKAPKTIDIKIATGEDKGKEQLGLYELDKGKLRLCVSTAGKPRPKEFGAKAGSDLHLFVFQRPKDVG